MDADIDNGSAASADLDSTLDGSNLTNDNLVEEDELSDIDLPSLSSERTELYDPDDLGEELDDAREGYKPRWKQDSYDPVQLVDFVAETGPSLPPGFNVDTAHPLDYFSLFFTDEMFEEMVKHTNGYASFVQDEKKRKTGNPRYTDKQLSDIDCATLKAFFGVNIDYILLAPIHGPKIG